MSPEYRYPGPPTRKLLKHVEDRISDLEWNGDPGGELEGLYNQREILRIMSDKGELYVPEF